MIDGALAAAGARAGDLAAVGITNQRETAVLWDRETGAPLHNAIVWQDTRTDRLVRELAGEAGPDRLRDRVGLPLSTYFSGPKVTWLLEHVAGARRAGAGGRADVRHDRRLAPVEPHRRRHRAASTRPTSRTRAARC